MKFTKEQLWDRFRKYYAEFPTLGLGIDISRMNFNDDYLAAMTHKMERAFDSMAELERGAIANPDENRMVGHYWLRNPSLAPTSEIRREIEQTVTAIKDFSSCVHRGEIRGANGPFKNLLVIGIGGSALGPQFVACALGHPARDKLKVWFFDNTDPDGFDKTLAAMKGQLGQTLCIVISKSGGTKETRNGMLEAQAEYERHGLVFAKHAVAITGARSELDKTATRDGWICRFPMWDWVGGRTSELSAVGLLPAGLQGIMVDEMLKGAAACDLVTRTRKMQLNPAAQMALMWFHIGNGKGSKDMVVLPYKDRLELFSRYLQQLLMESLGKERDLDGRIVNQGIAVYGNKGSTDQHAYVQQLRDGVNNFFVTFIEVLRDREAGSCMVEPGVTSGDFLHGFFLGTRQALYEKDRESITLTLDDVTPYHVGVLVAFFERAVGFYASLININAYHQPGVEAGKKAAGTVIQLQSRILEFLSDRRRNGATVEEIAAGIGGDKDPEAVFKVCEHLSRNPDRGVQKESGSTPFVSKYWLIA